MGEQIAVQKAMKKGMNCVEERGQNIKNGLKVNDMMELQAGEKIAEFGRQSEANNKLPEISGGRDKTEIQLFN